MQATIHASELNWMTNGNGLWAAHVQDLSGGSVTFSEGYTPTITNKLVKVTNATKPTGTVTYQSSGNGAQATAVLYGINNVRDSEDCVTGSLGRKIGSVDLSTLEWTEGDGSFIAEVDGIKADTANIMTSNGYETTVSGNIVTIVSSSSPTGMMYFELASAVQSSTVQQPVAMQDGVNALHQVDSGRTADFDLNYNGTSLALALISTRKYAFSDNGVKSVFTGETVQDVTTGEDMLVDITQLCNGVSTKIASIQTWDDLVSAYPEYAQYVEYNTGTVTGVQPTVKANTYVRNQLVQNGNFSDGTTSWTTSGQTTSVSDNVLSITYSAGGNDSSRRNVRQTIGTVSGHTYLVTCEMKDTLAGSGKIAINFASVAVNTQESTSWVRYYVKATASSGSTVLYTSIYNYAVSTEVTMQLRGVMIIDLTQLCHGHQSLIDQIQTWDDLVAFAPDYANYVAFDSTGTEVVNGGTAQAPAPLFAVGNAADEFEAIAGVTTHKIGSYTFTGQESWVQWGSDPTIFELSNVVIDAARLPSNNYDSAILVGYLPAGRMNASTPDLSVTVNTLAHGANKVFIKDSSCADANALVTKLVGKTLYYELAEPTTSTSTSTQISFQVGTNVAMQTDGGRTADFDLNYNGTDYSIDIDATHKYVTRINSTDGYVTGETSIDVVGKRDKLIDLTYMFGAGNEPATVAEFYRLFPTWKTYNIPYDKGSLLNFKGTGIVSVGFNLVDFGGRTLGAPQNTDGVNTAKRGVFDETKYYIGLTSDNYYYPTLVTSYSVSDSQIVVTASQTTYGVSFPIRCVPGATYRFESYQNSRNRFSFYTYDGTFISGIASQSAEAPANAYWCMVNYCTTGTNETTTFTNPCVHIQWSGTRNGDYEQYWSYTRPLPTLTYFPDGMNGVGPAADEITSKQAVQRVRLVNLDDIDWTESEGTWVNQFSDMKPDTASIIATHSQSFTLSGNTVTFTSQPTGYLVYELGTPVVTPFQDEVNLSYQVSDYGTESIVPVNGTTLSTAPLTAMVQYQGDYARTITKLPENYQSQKSMDALLELLGQLHNGVFTSTFNSATQSYGYSFTSNN